MKTFHVTVTVRLKPGVLDPQGKAIEGALGSLDFSGVETVRQGKVFDLVLQAASQDAARDAASRMGEKLLANTVIENFDIEISGE